MELAQAVHDALKVISGAVISVAVSVAIFRWARRAANAI